MPGRQKYTDWTKEELVKYIESLEKRNKYGLVWDEKREPEKVVLECREKLPVLSEVKSKEIKNNPNELTHILIEGDNYHSLSVLNYTHGNAIDIIYIDPPYNTGRSEEWQYNDKWVDKEDSYRHSKWLSFMSKRLYLAKNLLSKRGVIFISIDDNEYAQLKLLCDEIFVEKRYVCTLIWEKKKKGSYLNDLITNIKEYVLVYRKGDGFFEGLIGQTASEMETYPCVNPGNTVGKRIIPKGISSNYREKNYILEKGTKISAGNMNLLLHSDLIIKNGILAEDLVIESEWRYTQDKMNEMARKGELYITQQLYLRHKVTEPRDKKLKDLLLRVERDSLLEYKEKLISEYEIEIPDEEKIKKLKLEIDRIESGLAEIEDLDNLYAQGWGSNEDGDNELRDFFGKKVFDYPKPTRLIQKLIASTRMEDAVILDFFAGTGTTGHAVLQLNKIKGNRQFILCTDNEDNNSSGLKIAEDICYPRIKKAIKGYKNRKGTKIKGLVGNLKYYRTSFVPSTPSDKNKLLLTRKSIEMLCLRENTFEFVKKEVDIMIYKNQERYLGIIFDQLKIPRFKEIIKDFTKKVCVYVFSLGDDDFSEEFSDLQEKVSVCSIPEAILHVYRRIFK